MAESQKPLNDYPFDSDMEAWENLNRYNITHNKGTIILSSKDTYPPQVLNAVDYLCDEWDYGVEWK